MGAYPLAILPLIKFLLEFIKLSKINAKEVVFADDFSVAGNLNTIKDYWDKLKALNSYLVVKEKKLMEAQSLFADSRVNIRAEGKTHLGAVIESIEYCDEYVKDLVKNWDNQPFCQLLQKHNRKQLI